MHSKRIITTLIGVATATTAFGLLGATAAYAGEVTGNGKSLKNPDGSLNGASICAFSGLNDTYSGDPSKPDAEGFTRTQSWGQLSPEARAFLAAMGAHPGDACKPGAAPEE